MISDFLGRLVYVILPNGRLTLGELQTNGQGVFGFPGVEFPEAAIEEVRKIEAPVEVNLIRAVIILKNS